MNYGYKGACLLHTGGSMIKMFKKAYSLQRSWKKQCRWGNVFYQRRVLTNFWSNSLSPPKFQKRAPQHYTPVKTLRPSSRNSFAKVTEEARHSIATIRFGSLTVKQCNLNFLRARDKMYYPQAQGCSGVLVWCCQWIVRNLLSPSEILSII